MIEAALCLENLSGGCPANIGQLNRLQAAFGRVACLKRFGHRPEILAQPGGLTAGDAERVQGFVEVKPEQLGASGRRSEGAAGPRGVEAVLVVARRHRLGNLALDFHAEVIREQQFLA